VNKLAALWHRLRGPAPADTVTSAASPPPDAFDLDLVPGRPVVAASADGSPRPLAPVAHGPRVALHLEAGTVFVTPPLELTHEHVLRVCAVAATGAGCTLHVDSLREAAATPLVTTLLHGTEPRTLLVSLAAQDATATRLRVRVDGGIAALLQLQVALPHRLARLEALSGYPHRVATEIANFGGAAYTHAMYGAGTPPTGAGVVRAADAATAPETCQERSQRLIAERVQAALTALVGVPPTAGETAFPYAMRALGCLLPMTPPDFLNRADRLTSARPLRMLSLCSGAARIEEQILANAKQPIQLTLLDASRELIQRAADRLATAAPHHRVDCLVGDINRGLPGEGGFDVIVCVSALHHVADLERVFAEIGERLDAGGEFWSIGEQIGRNGNRLWPDARELADRAFARLPARLRRNAHTGKVDERITDADFSLGCFEGIRSKELETMLEAHLLPVDVYKRNAFLWRLVDATYADNYRLDDAADLQHLRELVAAEFAHWATGGRATELHGVYRKKELRRS
jgi:SAM-dependent methyltransferase